MGKEGGEVGTDRQLFYSASRVRIYILCCRLVQMLIDKKIWRNGTCLCCPVNLFEAKYECGECANEL